MTRRRLLLRTLLDMWPYYIALWAAFALGLVVGAALAWFA